MERKKRSKKKSFAEMFGVEGQGIPVRISQETKDFVRECHERSERAIKAGEYFAKTCKLKFG